MTQEKLLFCWVTWREWYDGRTGDKATGGGSFIEKHGYGFEVFNFRSYQGRFFGPVTVTGGSRIRIDKLGAGPDAEITAPAAKTN